MTAVGDEYAFESIFQPNVSWSDIMDAEESGDPMELEKLKLVSLFCTKSVIMVLQYHSLFLFCIVFLGMCLSEATAVYPKKRKMMKINCLSVISPKVLPLRGGLSFRYSAGHQDKTVTHRIVMVLVLAHLLSPSPSQ